MKRPTVFTKSGPREMNDTELKKLEEQELRDMGADQDLINFKDGLK